MGENSNEVVFTHILQKTGILKNFSISRLVTASELDKIKNEIRKNTSNDEEFKKEFQKKISEYGNMHDPKNPIPGIIYLNDEENKRVIYAKYAKEWAKKIKEDGTPKKELAMLIKMMIAELGLTKEDFTNQEREMEEDDDGGDEE
jgi:hypothetical protein